MADAYLHGTILDDGGLPCEGRFEHGPTPAMGNFTAWQNSLRTGDGFQEHLLGLAAGIMYYFRAIARNASGTTVGATATFTTFDRAPVIATMAATNVAPYSATLNYLVVDSSGQYCTVWFEYGMTTGYGNETTKVLSQISGDSGGIDVSGLASGRPFHFRAVAQSIYGVGYGIDMVLNTLEEPSPISGLNLELALLLEE